MKGFKPTDESKEATEIIELASEQIETLASAFDLIAKMLGDASDESTQVRPVAEDEISCTLH